MSRASAAGADPPRAAKAACRFLALREDLEDPAAFAGAIRDCAAHLVAALGLDGEAAYDTALAAWAQAIGGPTEVEIDLAASTPWLVVLVDRPAGVRRAVPVTNLLRLLGPRAVAAGLSRSPLRE